MYYIPGGLQIECGLGFFCVGVFCCCCYGGGGCFCFVGGFLVFFLNQSVMMLG